MPQHDDLVGPSHSSPIGGDALIVSLASRDPGLLYEVVPAENLAVPAPLAGLLLAWEVDPEGLGPHPTMLDVEVVSDYGEKATKVSRESPTKWWVVATGPFPKNLGLKSLLDDLGTICLNKIKPTEAGLRPFSLIATPTPIQRRAFELLGVSHRLGVA